MSYNNAYNLKLLLRTSALGLVLCVLPVSAEADTIWTGAVDSDWFNAENWTDGVPDNADGTYVDNATLSIDGTTTSAYILLLGNDIGTTAEITVSGGGAVTSSEATVMSQNTGSSSIGTVTGAGSSWSSGYSFLSATPAPALLLSLMVGQLPAPTTLISVLPQLV